MAVEQPQFQLKRILLPVDFSGTSRKALAYAVSFAKQFNADVLLLHVIEPALTTPQMETIPARAFGREHREDCAEELMAWQREFQPVAAAVVREGTPYREIVAFARENGIDLIILGTQGLTGLAHIFGSTAERVVRQAPCPVLVVRQHERDFVLAESTG